MQSLPTPRHTPLQTLSLRATSPELTENGVIQSPAAINEYIKDAQVEYLTIENETNQEELLDNSLDVNEYIKSTQGLDLASQVSVDMRIYNETRIESPPPSHIPSLPQSSGLIFMDEEGRSITFYVQVDMRNRKQILNIIKVRFFCLILKWYYTNLYRNWEEL